jgi:hypothetical protein
MSEKNYPSRQKQEQRSHIDRTTTLRHELSNLTQIDVEPNQQRFVRQRLDTRYTRHIDQ